MIFSIISFLILGSISAHFDDFELDDRYLRHRNRDDLKEREYTGDDVRDGQRIHFLAQLERREEELAAFEDENRNDASSIFPSLSRNRRSNCKENDRLRGHFNPRKFLRCLNGQWTVNNCPPGTEFDFVHQAFVDEGHFL